MKDCRGEVLCVWRIDTFYILPWSFPGGLLMGTLCNICENFWVTKNSELTQEFLKSIMDRLLAKKNKSNQSQHFRLICPLNILYSLAFCFRTVSNFDIQKAVVEVEALDKNNTIDSWGPITHQYTCLQSGKLIYIFNC